MAVSHQQRYSCTVHYYVSPADCAWCQEPPVFLAPDHSALTLSRRKTTHDSALTFTWSKQATDIPYKHTIALQKISISVCYLLRLPVLTPRRSLIPYQVLSASIRCTPQCRDVFVIPSTVHVSYQCLTITIYYCYTSYAYVSQASYISCKQLILSIRICSEKQSQTH